MADGLAPALHRVCNRVSSSRGRQSVRPSVRALRAATICVAFSLFSLLLRCVQADREASTRSRSGTTTNKSRTALQKKPVISLSSAEMLDHIQDWTSDVTVFYYTKWCPFCKMLGPYWDQVGQWHQQVKSKDLVVARFDCEQSLLAADICTYMGVQQYPMIQFLGAGSYYQNDPLTRRLYGRQNLDRSVFFEGVPDPEMMKDWTNMMRGISKWHRMKNRALSVFGLGPKAQADIASLRKLQKENEALKDELRWVAEALNSTQVAGEEPVIEEVDGVRSRERRKEGSGGWGGGARTGTKGQRQGDEKARADQEALQRFYDDIIDKIEAGEGTEQDLEAAVGRWTEDVLGEMQSKAGTSDPFVELSSPLLESGEAQGVRACLRDFMGDYCREIAEAKEEKDAYCELLPTCVTSDFAAEGCLPSRCPLRPEGCERISNCLRNKVRALYTQILTPVPTSA